MGINIKANAPKNPDIVITNDFSKSIDELTKILLKKINDAI